jgi:hypothetical protein
MITYFVCLGAFIVTVSSCDKDDDQINKTSGTITGVVSDDAGLPIPDVTVTVSGVNEEDMTVTTGTD